MIDRLGTRDQQSLHMKFWGRLEKPGRSLAGSPRIIKHRHPERFDVLVHHGVPGEQGGENFQEPAAVKERTCPAENFRPLSEHGQVDVVGRDVWASVVRWHDGGLSAKSFATPPDVWAVAFADDSRWEGLEVRRRYVLTRST